MDWDEGVSDQTSRGQSLFTKIFDWHNFNMMSLYYFLGFFDIMHAWYFYFYATMVNILAGFYTPQKLFTWGLGFYNVVMQFLFSFLNAMRMQKSKYVKMEIIHAMRKSKYG